MKMSLSGNTSIATLRPGARMRGYRPEGPWTSQSERVHIPDSLERLRRLGPTVVYQMTTLQSPLEGPLPGVISYLG